MNLQRTGEKTAFLGSAWPVTLGDGSPLLAASMLGPPALPLLHVGAHGRDWLLPAAFPGTAPGPELVLVGISVSLSTGCVCSLQSCTWRKRSRSVLGGSPHAQMYACQSWHAWVPSWGPHAQVNSNHEKLHEAGLQPCLSVGLCYCFGVTDLTNRVQKHILFPLSWLQPRLALV